MIKTLLILTVLASLTVASYADRHFMRHYTDSHCNNHLQTIRVDDEGNEEIEDDAVISITTPCDDDQ